MYDILKIKKDLKNLVKEKRYEHSILVAEEAIQLAKYYNYDEEKAYVAGLVHDIAKEFSEEENKKWIEKYNLSKNFLLPKYEKIVHAEVGSVVVKEWYKLDNEISNAVKYHTIGNPNMTLLEKIVFISDKIGRKEKTEKIEELKKLAYEDLDKALLRYLQYQKEKLESKDKEFHPLTKELYNKLEKK